MDRITARMVAEVVQNPHTTLDEAESLIAAHAKTAASWALAEEAAKRVIALDALLSREKFHA